MQAQVAGQEEVAKEQSAKLALLQVACSEAAVLECIQLRLVCCASCTVAAIALPGLLGMGLACLARA